MNRLWLMLASCFAMATATLACDSDSAPLTGSVIESQVFPVVTGFSPNPARPGQRVTIHGRNFGTDRSATTVTFGGVHGAVASVANDRIQADLPATIAAGSHPVRVTVAGRSSAASQLLIDPAAGQGSSNLPIPVITSITPNPARAGERIVISGRNFGTDKSAVSVTLDGEPANVASVTDTRIDADVPSSANAGAAMLVVTVDDRSVSSALTIDPAAEDGGSGDDGSGGESGADDGSGTGGDGSGGDGSGGDGGDGSGGDGSGGDGSGDQAPDVAGTYDVEAGIASNSCPANYSVDMSGLLNETVVTQDGSSVTSDMSGGLTFTDDHVTTEGDFDASNGNDRLQKDFSQDAFTGTLTRDLGICSVTFSLQGTKR